jgi:type I restriction enzyme S subunit
MNNCKVYNFSEIFDLIKKPISPVEGQKYVQGGHMVSDQVKIDEYGIVGDGYLGPAFRMEFLKGDILFGSRRTYLRKIARTDFDGVTSNTTFVFRSRNESVMSKLGIFAMYSQSFINHTISKSRGSTNPYILYSDFANYPLISKDINNPNNLLNTFEKIEDTIIKCKKLLEITEKNLYKFNLESCFIDCEKVPLPSVASILMGVSPPGKEIGRQGEYRFLQGGADFGKKIPISEIYTNDSKRLSSAEDILMTVRAPVGDICFSDQEYRIGRGIAAIRPKSINRQYLFIHLLTNQRHWRKREQGSTFLAINKKDILEYPVNFVDKEQQLRLAKKYSGLNDLRILLEEQIVNLRLLRRTIATEVF